MSRERLRITVTGAVQGLGFRPHVHRLARALALAGFVRNRGAEVEIEVEGECPQRLLEALATTPLPAAAIERVDCEPLADRGECNFRIAPSVATGAGATPRVLPDLACCAACLREVGDRHSRYFRYPFTNCSHCGPRYSIQRAVPYDRAHTTMAPFTMCTACRAEYDDPHGRRFHAQPTACPACGPRLAFAAADGVPMTGAPGDPLAQAAALIAAGGILALKGVGGYQLLVDARNAQAIARLRARKHRPAKALAVLVPDLAGARGLCRVNRAEAALLASAAAPIVVLERRPGALPAGVAPDLHTLGVMLPPSALHHLLLGALAGPVICTSGNRAAEPIAIDDGDARARLAGIADAWLSHDRAIHRALDDSVVRVIDGAPQLLRVGRGYAPTVLPYRAQRAVLACGGQLKNTVAVAAGARVVVSQHLGDLDDALALDAMQAAAADLCAFHAIDPRLAARDAHPDYAADGGARGRALPCRRVPHHLAHALAVMLEHALAGPLLAVVWDGNGLGPDGTSWGGEFLVVERRGGVRWRRAAHLRPYPLPGGDAAARDPQRALSGLLWALPAYHARIPAAHRALLDRGLNCPPTTSAGRLFDALAALAGCGAAQSYEGQAAGRLEQAARGARARPYPLPAAAGVLDWAPLLEAAIADRDGGAAAGPISARFHAGLAAAIVRQARSEGLSTVILTGGCFQNRLLSEAAIAGLRAAGMTPLIARRLPPHDGALAAGQLVAACEGFA